MRDYLKKHKHEIIIGAVGSLVGAFIMGVGNWFISTAPKIGSSAFETIQNIIYTLAATQTNNYLIFLIICAALGVCFGSIIVPFGKEVSSFITTLKLEKELKTLPDRIVNELNRQLNLEKEKSAIPSKTADEILKNRKHSSFLGIIALLLGIVLYIITILFVLRPTSIRDKFDQDITIIYPYVEEQQVLQLKSDWVLMRSKADYMSIYEYINMVKEENDLLR